MQSGIVKIYWPDKAYGFISPDDGGRDIFIHKSAVRSAGLQSIEVGMPVAFDVVADPVKSGRVAATNLRLRSGI